MTCANLTVSPPNTSNGTVQVGDKINVPLTHSGTDTLNVSIRLLGKRPSNATLFAVGSKTNFPISGAIPKTQYPVNVDSTGGIPLGSQICVIARVTCPSARPDTTATFIVGP